MSEIREPDSIGRRDFMRYSTMMAAGTAVVSSLSSCSLRLAGSKGVNVPSYLKRYADLYARDPKAAALKWFRNAKFGLFMHYGIYSAIQRRAWCQYQDKIPVAEYEKLKKRFTARKFDADSITDLALAAKMKYVNITTKHHDGFCLFKTATTDFNSFDSPAKRDIVAELAAACDKKGLGLCLYYSHGREWRHPDAPNNNAWGGKARPEYNPPDPGYHYGKEHDINRYVDYMHAQLTELLTNYGSIASIWLDGYGVPVSGPIKRFRIPETYALIRKLQPQTLISAKWGYTGDEDYYAPEYHWLTKNPGKTKKALASGKPIELCVPIARWSYNPKTDGKHRGVASIWRNLAYAARFRANLLLNTALRPEGDVDKQDAANLRKLGEKIRCEGWPKPA